MVDQRRFDDQRYVDARTAARRLEIQLRTLYAYVSRGQIRSVAGAKGRPRMYAAADVERLRVRRDARKGHGAVAAGALRWGEPVLDSAITQITAQGPRYRGHLATSLSSFEATADLLWSGYLPRTTPVWARDAVPISQLARWLATPHPFDAMKVLVSIVGSWTSPADDHPPQHFIACGRMLIPMLAATINFSSASFTRALAAPTVAEICARAIGTEHVELIERVLILLADHELNASSFAARVAASTDAAPDACVLAALATLSGPKHGAAAERIAALKPSELRDLDLGHPLYPAGDPRTPPLLALARPLATTRRAKQLLAICDAQRIPPTVDLALALVAAVLDAPPSIASALFAVARCAGWLAHAMEQRAAGFILRPRARYIGP